MPASGFEPAAQLRIRAWIASRGRDRKAERASLERLVELEPGDTLVLGRLAEIAIEDGDHAELARLRERQRAMTEAKERYQAPAAGRSFRRHCRARPTGT